MRKFISCISAIAVIVGTTATPAMAAVTILDTVTADDANATTLAAMAAQCEVIRAAAALGSPDRWTADVVEGDVAYVSGPTEVGTHTFALNGTGVQTGAGTFTPAHTEIEGNPYRNGGSVNMFGDAIAKGGHYSASSYDFTNNFTSVYSHAFNCEIFQEVFHPATVIHHKAVGEYKNFFSGNGQGNDNDDDGIEDGQPQGACAAYNSTGDTLPFWGQDKEQCKFVGTPAYDEQVPSTYDDPELFATVAGTPINQSQTEELSAHEDAGEGFDTSETLFIGKVVVCISPTTSTQTKKGAPGTWVLKNGYTGTKCTTDWYNTGATIGVSNLNTGSHNIVTVPIV